MLVVFIDFIENIYYFPFFVLLAQAYQRYCFFLIHFLLVL